jgi:5-methylcytosine-specific restriction endonuclease McrA
LTFIVGSVATVCTWCNEPLGRGSAVDHIIPLSRGGPNVAWNRELLHRRCNQEKGNLLTSRAIALAELHGITLLEPRRRYAAAPRPGPGSLSGRELFRALRSTAN